MIAAAALAMIAALGGPGAARGAEAPLPDYEYCIADVTVGNPGACEARAGGLEDGGATVVSPDGASLYTLSIRDHAIAAFALDPASGEPSSLGCIEDVDAGDGVCDQRASGLYEPSSIAVGADGRFVYVSAAGIQRFRRLASGRLVPRPCAGRPGSAATGCEVLVGDSLAISPDGRVLYAVAQHGVIAYDIDPDNGVLSFRECAASSFVHPDDGPPLTGCGFEDPGLYGVWSVEVTADGRAVYARTTGANDGRGSNAIVLLRRAPATGSISSVECLFAALYAPDCPPAPWKGNPSDIAISPDGRSLYVPASYLGDFGELHALMRTRLSGALEWIGCVGDPATFTHCESLRPGMAGGVWVHPNGRTILHRGSTPAGERVLTAFTRRTPSELPTWGGCLTAADNPKPGCDPVPRHELIGSHPVAGPTGLLYDHAENRLRVFSEGTPPPQTRIVETLLDHGRSVELRLLSSVPGSHFRCRLDDDPWARCDDEVAYADLPAGRHRFAARAIDPDGRRDPTQARFVWRAGEA